MHDYLAPVLGRDELGATAARLATTALNPSTYRTYGTGIQSFFQYCLEDGVHPLAISQVHAARFVAWLGLRGTVAAASLQPYLSAVNRFLGNHGVQPVALGLLVASVRRGLAGAQVDTQEPPLRVPLPAEAVVAFIVKAATLMAARPVWPDPPDDAVYLFRALLACAVSFLYFQRGEAGASCRTADLAPHDSGIILYARDYKGARGVPAVKRPIHQLPAASFPTLLALLRFFDAQRTALNGGTLPPFRWAITTAEPASTWTAATLTTWLRQACAATHQAPPPGYAWTSHSLRKGAATAAYAVGVPLLKIKYCGDWAQESHAVHRYIDVTALPTAAARQLFGWLVPVAHPTASGRPVA